ncbi:MAG: type II secretion system protein [Gallionella sp.]|nr:type II secretion system protein [Gallionella sp.]
MKSTRGQSFKLQMQKGFTLVELAIVLVIAGIILVGVLKGTDAINKAKVERMVADIKGLQGSALEFQKRNGRLPGDCNNNGVVQLAISVATTIGVNNTVDKVIRNPETLAVCGQPTATTVVYKDDLVSGGTSPTGPLMASGVAVTAPLAAAAASEYNLPWNEMRRAGIMDGNRTNEELARHGFNDIYAFSSMRIAAAGTTPETKANVIVVYGIPVWMAEAIDAQIDGVATSYGDDTVAGPAATGRVRLWSENMTMGTAGSGAGNDASAPFAYVAGGQFGTDRDLLVSISYQYDPLKLVK